MKNKKIFKRKKDLQPSQIKTWEALLKIQK